jgi:hypothetical protein
MPNGTAYSQSVIPSDYLFLVHLIYLYKIVHHYERKKAVVAISFISNTI